MRDEAGAGLGCLRIFLALDQSNAEVACSPTFRIEHELKRALVKGSVGIFLGKTAGDGRLVTIGLALKGAALSQNHESKPSGVGRLSGSGIQY